MIASTRPTLIGLSLTMLAVCGLTAADTPAPAPVPAANDALAVADAARSSRDAAAQSFYVRGMKAREEARLDDALKDLTVAVDYAPDNALYRKALDEARAMSGLSRDTRSVAIDRAADELQVRQQQLWGEAQALMEDGTKQLTAGAFDDAERQFQLAVIRLESLPYTDPRREVEMRRAESLAKEAQGRRAKSEQEVAAGQTKAAAEHKQELRDLSLKLERDRIDAMLNRAQRARERRDYDEAILLSEQVLKINRAEDRASSLLVKCRRERHVYLRQVTADRWDEEHKLLNESIRSAMLPQLELIRYSADWPEIDARRSAPVRGLEDETDNWRKNIDDQLEQEVTIDFQDTDLADVVVFLQRITSVNLVLDPQVLATTPPPVTLKAEKLKLRFVLNFIMKLTNLHYAMRDEAIYISNQEGVRGESFMKLYDVRDLTHAMQAFPGPDLDIPEPGGQGSKLLPPVEPTEKPETGEFVDIIKKVVAPNTWNETNTIEDINGSMVVTQSRDVHAQVAELLRSLRNQKGTQIHVKVKFLEIENSALEEIGVDWQNFTGANRPGQPAIVPLPGQTVNNNTPSSIGAYLAAPGSAIVGAAAVNNQLQSYGTDAKLPYNSATEGFRFNAQTWQISNNLYASAILHAVEKERKGNIILEPDLSMFNGQQAHLVNMNQQSYIADYDVVQGQYDPIISVLSYGTVLDVQAIASADKKYVTLSLRPTNAKVLQWRRFGAAVPDNTFPGGPVVGGGADNGGGFNINFSNGGNTATVSGNAAPAGGVGGAAIAGENPLLIPELIYQSVRTSVTIPDGGSLVIAGMTRSESGNSHSGIPFLSHIPFLGRLFSTNGRSEVLRKNMIIVQADVVLFEEIEQKL